MNVEKFMQEVNNMFQNAGLLICDNKLVGYYGDDNVEVVVPEGVIAIASDCFENRRLKKLVLPSSAKEMRVNALNNCILGELVLGVANADETNKALNACNIGTLTLLGANEEYNLCLEGSTVNVLIAQEGVKKVKITSGIVKNVGLPHSVKLVEQDTLNCDQPLNLRIGDDTWLNPGSLTGVMNLVVNFKSNKGLKALRYLTRTLDTAGVQDGKQVILVNSGLNIFEALRLKTKYPNVIFTFKTLTSNKDISEVEQQNQFAKSR